MASLALSHCETYLPARFHFSKNVANQFAVALGGHHGYFRLIARFRLCTRTPLAAIRWKTARELSQTSLQGYLTCHLHRPHPAIIPPL